MSATKPPPKPPKSILSEKFRYTDAAHTDIAATFARLGWVAPSVAKAQAKEKATA